MPVVRVFDTMGRWTGLLACLAAAASALTRQPAAATGSFALLGAVGILIAHVEQERRGPRRRSRSQLADDVFAARTVEAIEAVVRAELEGWNGLHLRWCALSPIVPTTDPHPAHPHEQDLLRVLARIHRTEVSPVRLEVAGGDAVAVPCGGASGFVLVVVARHLSAAAEEELVDIAGTIGVAVRKLAVDAKAADHRASARFEGLVRFASDAIFIVDAGGRIRYATPSVTTVLGHLSSDLQGRSLSELVVADHAADVGTFVGQVQLQDARSPTSVALRFQRADGTTIDGELTGANLLDNPDVRGIVTTVRDVSARVALEQQLRHQAFHDGLTGLANRALFRDRLDRSMRVRRGPRDHAPAVAFLDLDDFKRINDTLGHAAGDALLRTVAERIEACLRGADTAARLGGDEFAVLIEETPADDAAVDDLLQRVIDSIRRPITLGTDRVVDVSASVGIAMATPDVGSSEDLLRHADMAMYRAKLQGKAQVVRYESAMHRLLHDRLELTAELDAAVRDHTLDVHYQPIIDLHSERVVAVEALVRWPHATLGMLPAGRFLDVAEESGLIVPLGTAVLERALDHLVEWRAMGLGDLVVSVNVSPREFLHEGFEDVLFDALEARALDPGCLVIEITEGALAPDPRAAADRLRRIADRGVRAALDDFGTGSSSLQALRTLPLHQLKIDRGFVSALRGDGADAGIAGTIVDLARSLGAVSVAEGIEDPVELDALRALGCSLGQGNLFGPPAAADAVLPMLMAHAAVTSPRAD